MARELYVRDVMIPIKNYSTVHEEDNVYKAIGKFKNSIHRKSGVSYEHHDLIVQNKEGDYTGILTLHNLFKAIELKEPWLNSATWSWFFINRIHQAEGIKVKEIMRPIYSITIDVDEPIKDAAKMLFFKDEDIIPVLENNVPVGIVRTIDIFWVIEDLF